MAMNGANGGQKSGPTNGYGDREQELRRKEQELKAREQEIRLRELEAEIMKSSEPAPPVNASDADYSETRKHQEPPNRWQRMKRKTKLALQFAALVIAALVIVQIAGIVMRVVLIAAIAGIAYFILFGGEKK